MLMKTFKFRIYPTKKQVETLDWTLARCCELYNACLQERRDAWTIIKRHPNFYDEEWRKQAMKDHGVSYYDQTSQLPELKEIREEYKEIGAHVLYNVLKRVERAYQNFFRRVKLDQTPGYPRYQSHTRYDSFCFPDTSCWKLIGNHLELKNIGTIKVRLHREVQGRIKTTTIKREGKRWYVTFSCEVDNARRTSYTDEIIGIDLGISKLATLSTGDVIENPRHYRKSEKKLAEAQQTLSRKKRGSNRRKKAIQKVARIHRKTYNQRNDYLHKWSRWLVDTYETIVFEDIKPANLSKRAKPKQDEETGEYLPNGASAKSGLNKSILDAGWNQFIAFCTYKAEDAGCAVVKVDPHYTSQACSNCGEVKKKELSERWHSCPCGCELDRDHNAALNIARLGSKFQGTRS